jgi:hypothetical protein
VESPQGVGSQAHRTEAGKGYESSKDKAMIKAKRTGLFWSKVATDGDCWLWTGEKNGDGYGRFFRDGKKGLAHRYAYEQVIGPIPDGLCICHVCDVRNCVRPAHLFPGTHADNNKDMQAKGRGRYLGAHGSKNGSAKLTQDDVRAIRRIYAAGGISQHALGRKFGVCGALVNNILHRRIWKHV